MQERPQLFITNASFRASSRVTESKVCILIELVDNEVPRRSETQADTQGLVPQDTCLLGT